MVCRLVIAVFLMLLFTGTAVAQGGSSLTKETKTDILGFRTRMSQADVMNKTASRGWCNTSFPFEKCAKFEDGLMEFEFSKDLESKIVRRIAYKFISGESPYEMVSYISQQYGASPSKSISESEKIDKEQLGGEEYR